MPGASAQRGVYPSALPERMPGTPTRGESGCQAPPTDAGPPALKGILAGYRGGGWEFRIPKSCRYSSIRTDTSFETPGSSMVTP